MSISAASAACSPRAAPTITARARAATILSARRQCRWRCTRGCRRKPSRRARRERADLRLQRRPGDAQGAALLRRAPHSHPLRRSPGASRLQGRAAALCREVRRRRRHRPHERALQGAGAARGGRLAAAAARPRAHGAAAAQDPARAQRRQGHHRSSGGDGGGGGGGGEKMSVRPFTIAVADDVLADLRARLARVRWPDEAPGEAWAYGTSLDYMKDLVAYWRDKYDWRAAEARLNERRQFMAAVG